MHTVKDDVIIRNNDVNGHILQYLQALLAGKSTGQGIDTHGTIHLKQKQRKA